MVVLSSSNARQQQEKDKPTVISLGKGQFKQIKETLLQARTKGKWVILQNIHLVQADLQALDDLVQQVCQHGEVAPHPRFQLVLTSRLCDFLPVTLLQHSLKLMQEHPRAFKSHVLQAVGDLPPARIAEIESLMQQL